jgi:hypothetical protein
MFKLAQTKSMCIKIYLPKLFKLKMQLIEKSRDLIKKKTLFLTQKIVSNLRIQTKNRFKYLGFRKKSGALRVSINCLQNKVVPTKKLIQNLPQAKINRKFI